MPEDSIEHIDFDDLNRRAISQPLVSHMYTADPSAHVLSMDEPGGEVTDHGIALHVKDVPWAEKQMWAPDALEHNGKYYLYFPAKRSNGIFQIGVAISDSPAGPFAAEPEAIAGTYSIDPAVFKDDDGKIYLYFGGIWGGQLQSYRNNEYHESNAEPLPHEPALGPRVAMLTDDGRQLAEAVREIVITDEAGNPLLAGDNDRRYFEAPWVHKYKGKYFFSYSTGDTHFICYAIGDNPYGPFTYKGVVLNPVVGWTNHHSIVPWKDRWYLFYHDSSLSKGVTHLRSVKMTELFYEEDGSIKTVSPYQE